MLETDYGNRFACVTGATLNQATVNFFGSPVQDSKIKEQVNEKQQTNKSSTEINLRPLKYEIFYPNRGLFGLRFRSALLPVAKQISPSAASPSPF